MHVFVKSKPKNNIYILNTTNSTQTKIVRQADIIVLNEDDLLNYNGLPVNNLFFIRHENYAMRTL